MTNLFNVHEHNLIIGDCSCDNSLKIIKGKQTKGPELEYSRVFCCCCFEHSWLLFAILGAWYVSEKACRNALLQHPPPCIAKMGLYVVGNISEECDQAEVTAVETYQVGPSCEDTSNDAFRKAPLIENIPQDICFDPLPFNPLGGFDEETAAGRLSKLRLGGKEQGHDFEHGILNVPHKLQLEDERSSSPFHSVASTQSSYSSVDTIAVTNAHRARFLVFIKILFRCLLEADECELRDRAKSIVAECIQRNRRGEPAFSPLIKIIENQLRPVVGDGHWRRASLLLRHFCIKHDAFNAPAPIPRRII